VGPGRVDYREVTQLVMLAPGEYQFQGSYKSDLISERGLEWRVVCAGKSQNVIGRGLVYRGTTAQWQIIEFSFTVPESGCPAQYLKLVFDARSASERFISGNIWFDDFKIAREEPEPAPSGEVRQPPPEASDAEAPGPQADEAQTGAAEVGIQPAPPQQTPSQDAGAGDRFSPSEAAPQPSPGSAPHSSEAVQPPATSQ
jgi:hypothetical protein